MRRKDKEMNDTADIQTVIEKAQVCRLAMTDGKTPYMVPLSFGYADNTLYFHSAVEGTKISILRNHPRVCFEMETDVAVKAGEKPCNYTMAFRSVMGFGTVRFIEDPVEKRRAMDCIVSRYGATPGDYDPQTAARTLVFCVSIDSVTGKRSGY
jgi:nitroimidazol reductase NimA-like FMN-containing flavoprotein (pyridoxamine 5'-phosphate oxidase superfamily)